MMLHNLSKAHAEPAATSDSTNAKEQSLTTILTTPEQRSELTLLVAACTASMRKGITDIFDPRYSGNAQDSRYDDPTDSSAGHNLAFTEADDKDEAKQQQLTEQRIKELSSDEAQELKHAALDFFDKWRDGVLGRVGEVLNSRDEAQQQGAQVQAGKAGASPVQAETTQDKKLGAGDAEMKASKDDANKETQKAIERVYPPIKTGLVKLEQSQRRLILHSIMLLLLSLEHYAAHSRVLLLHLTTSLNLPASFLVEDESLVAQTLLKAAEAMSAEKEKEKKAEENATGRKWKVGLATVAGAAVIGITGGLAAPLLAAGLGTVMGGLGLAGTATAGYLGTVASSTLVVGGLFGAYGGKMTGKMMDEYAKDVEDFAFVPIHNLSRRKRKEDSEKRRLRVLIAISGWLTDKEEVIKPWRIISPSIEAFALKYEVEALLNLGNALSIMLKSQAWLYAKKEILKRTIFAALKEALWPLALLKVARIVDNPFSVAKARSDKAGAVLADALINKCQGERPVTLVGYSLGARVIYSCLTALAQRRAFGLIDNVVLLGAPAPSDAADWRRMRAVVAGRLVNVYSRNDYILGFLYRTSSVQFGVAGLDRAAFVRGVENVDVSDLVSGHLRYRYLTGAILERIGLEDVDVAEVELEEEELAAVEEAEQSEHQRHGHHRSGVHGDTSAGAKDAPGSEAATPDEHEAERLEKEVAARNEQSMMDWASAKMHAGSQQASALFAGWSGRDRSEAAEATQQSTTRQSRDVDLALRPKPA